MRMNLLLMMIHLTLTTVKMDVGLEINSLNMD
jgi:hypothetical protein